jgi:hypothetical protein
MRYSVLLFLFTGLTVYAQQTGKIEYSRFSDTVPQSSISVTLSDSIYSYVESNLTFIDFDDCNNCDARAHLISAIIEKRFAGVKVAKVWMFANCKRASMSEKYRFRENIYLRYDGECDSWGYHVAPMIIFAHSHGIDTIVIDPSTQDSPVPLSKWIDGLLSHDEGAYLIVKDRKYFSFPDDENNRFEDMKEVWTDDANKPLLDEDCSISIENIFSARNIIWDPWTYRHYINAIRNLLN